MVCLEDTRFILVWAESPYVQFIAAALLLALKVSSRGYKRTREGNDPKSLVKGVSGCSDVDRCSVVRLCRALVRIYIGS